MLEHLNIGASVVPSKNQADQTPLTAALNDCLKNLRYQVDVYSYSKTGLSIDVIASPGIWG